VVVTAELWVPYTASSKLHAFQQPLAIVLEEGVVVVPAQKGSACASRVTAEVLASQEVAFEASSMALGRLAAQPMHIEMKAMFGVSKADMVHND
jgi:hypothetical protein